MKKKKNICIIMTVAVIFSALINNTYAKDEIRGYIEKTAGFITENVKEPAVSPVGGEWAVFSLSRSGAEAGEEFYNSYKKNLSGVLLEKNGVLHDKKNTEYARAVIALGAIGEDPENFSGYDLTLPLLDYDKTVNQGINGAVWALIALDSGEYHKEDTVVREKYIEKLLSYELPGGGFSLSAGNDETLYPDISAMAVTALSGYPENEAAKKAKERTLDALSGMQTENGGFLYNGEETSEAISQVITALCVSGEGISDERFIKGGKTLLDALIAFYNDDGGFSHIKGGKSDLMASEQALYALAALKRYQNNESGLFDLKSEKQGINIPNDPDDKKPKILFPGKTFSDIDGCFSKEKIEALAQRGIIDGKGDGIFDPDAPMTRAEFAAITVRGLGLMYTGENSFSDVNENDWFYKYINTAHFYNIVNGVSEKEFCPYESITKEQAVTMLMRAARLLGYDEISDKAYIRNILSQFGDYIKISDWAFPSMAKAVEDGIISDKDYEINPKTISKRSEIADMLYNLLEKTGRI